MDYEIPESLRLMQETIRRFVNQDLEPLSQQVEDEDHIPEEIVQKMRELGLFGLSIPEEYGGFPRRAILSGPSPMYRIYEGTSEIQRMVIARELTKE